MAVPILRVRRSTLEPTFDDAPKFVSRRRVRFLGPVLAGSVECHSCRALGARREGLAQPLEDLVNMGNGPKVTLA